MPPIGSQKAFPAARDVSSLNIPLWVVVVAFAVRLAASLSVTSSFCPDEYYQSVEIAHDLVFGYGHRSWEWAHCLRSFVHPLLFAAPMKLLQVLGLDRPAWVEWAPRMVQGVLAALGDVMLWPLAMRFTQSSAVASYAVVAQLTSWFMAYAGARTLANSFETSLVCAALALWPWSARALRTTASALPARWHRAAFALAAVAACVRPTAVLPLLPAVGDMLLFADRAQLPRLLGDAVGFGGGALAACALVDSALYGRAVLPALVFLRFNVLQGGASWFGTHPWHWYLTQGVPAVLATHLPLVLLGARGAAPHALLLSAALPVLLLSFLGHKEFRFLMAAVPPAMVLAGRALHRLALWRGRRAAVVLLALLALLNLGAVYYTGRVHQSGTTEAVRYLRQLPADRLRSVDFLMPCYAVPLYAFLHRPVPARLLDCSPPPQHAAATYRDEADRFYDDPVAFVQARYRAADARPSHIVLYDNLWPVLQATLEGMGYRPVHSVFHTHFAGDTRASRHVLVLERERA